MKKKYPYLFNKKKREIARKYTRSKIIAGVFNGFFVPALFFLYLLSSGGSTQIFEITKGLGMLAIPAYAAIFMILLSLIQIPLKFYYSFIYEHKHELSNQSVYGWSKDYGKSKILSFLFFIPTVTIVYYLMTFPNWWIVAGIYYLIIMAVMDYLSPVVILPFFYKLKPYTDTLHKKKILNICKRLGAGDIKNVLIANESEKSVKANALFTGFGKTKRIVLFDTLLNTFTKAEIETVIGHEVGHYVNKDILKGFILETLLIFPILYLVDVSLNMFSSGYAIQPYMIMSLPLFMVTYMSIDFILMPFLNAYSRHVEAKADLFALEHIKKPKAQISTEKRLADNSLQDENPPKWMELLVFDHPTVSSRIKMAKEWKRK